AGNVRYRHDAAGRVIQRTRTRLSRKPETWHYQWDADNRLTAVTTPDGTTWHYHYDPMGRRITKRHVDATGQELAATSYAWDGNALAEQAEHGPGPGRSRVTTWDYRPGTFTPLTQATRTSLRDAPQQVIDEEFHSIITDLTGTPSELVAPDGTLAGHQQRTLWGATTWHPDGASTPLRFPGQYHDPETGLHYNNQRYYDPHAGAYLTPDPLGLAASPSPHAYVPNPHTQTDPLGLMSCETGNPGDSGVTPIYRVSPAERGTSELDHGLDPANFPRTSDGDLDGAARFGNEARVKDFAARHSATHGVGFRVDVPTSWLSRPEIDTLIGMTEDQLEYVIPRELFGEFNQFPRSPWSSGR
ncbi:MAG: RHS repeat-associated core domain-containing protein, partial [Nocardiopsaceae bacterium]|nr:RHS repeat-associated core domain-containing protein [Nocardiopsaceae bacterium]